MKDTPPETQRCGSAALHQLPHSTPLAFGQTYHDWLATIGDGDQCSLYFHVPFCAEMCWYCGCHTKIINRYQPIADYAAVIGQEVALVANSIPGTQTVRRRCTQP